MGERLTLSKLSEAWTGFVPVSEQRKDPTYPARFQAALDLIENKKGYNPLIWRGLMQEAMTTSDFPLMFADSLSRELLARYQIVQPGLPQALKRRTVKDFRAAKSFQMTGGNQRLQRVSEKGEPLARNIVESKYEITADVWEAQWDFSWKAYINDDLGAFKDIPQAAVDSCMNTLEYRAVSIFMTAAGMTAGAFNAAIATAALAEASLTTGIQAMLVQTEPTTGEPISVIPRYLVTGPGQKLLAQRLLTSDYLLSTAAAPIPASNILKNQGLQLIIDEWFPVVNTTNGATCWMLLADPNQCPAGQVAVLEGHEAPEIWMKSSNAMRLGGSEMNPFDGDFETDNIMYKVRYCFETGNLLTRGAYASTGAA